MKIGGATHMAQASMLSTRNCFLTDIPNSGCWKYSHILQLKETGFETVIEYLSLLLSIFLTAFAISKHCFKSIINRSARFSSFLHEQQNNRVLYESREHKKYTNNEVEVHSIQTGGYRSLLSGTFHVLYKVLP